MNTGYGICFSTSSRNLTEKEKKERLRGGGGGEGGGGGGGCSFGSENFFFLRFRNSQSYFCRN